MSYDIDNKYSGQQMADSVTDHRACRFQMLACKKWKRLAFIVSRGTFEPEPGFEPRVSRSLAWGSYQLSYPSSHSSSWSNVPLETIMPNSFIFYMQAFEICRPCGLWHYLPSADHYSITDHRACRFQMLACKKWKRLAFIVSKGTWTGMGTWIAQLIRAPG